MKMKKVLIIGYGSIGQRHEKLLKKLGVIVSIFSRRKIKIPNRLDQLSKINEFKFKYVIIANETSEHFKYLRLLRKHNYKGIILVEKPLFHKYIDVKRLNLKKVYVAYNFRFNPIINKIKELIKKKTVISVNIYAGGYLPGWRPKRSYKKSYSSNKKQGGGVLRDLSHELDYSRWIFGKFKSIFAYGGHLSKLKIDSDDIYQIQIITKSGATIQVELNYLDRVNRRKIIINTYFRTYEADIINNTLKINNRMLKFNNDKNVAYVKMHKSILSNNLEKICTLKEANETMKVIDIVESSNKSNKNLFIH